MKNTFSATSNKATPEGSTHCLLIIWRKLGQKNLCYSVMSITKEMTLNDNSLLHYLKKPEKNDKLPPPKANTSTPSRRSKIPTTDLRCLNDKNAIRNRPTTGHSPSQDPSSPIPGEEKA